MAKDCRLTCPVERPSARLHKPTGAVQTGHDDDQSDDLVMRSLHLLLMCLLEHFCHHVSTHLSRSCQNTQHNQTRQACRQTADTKYACSCPCRYCLLVFTPAVVNVWGASLLRKLSTPCF